MPSGPRSALIVEDDPDFSAILRHLLSPWRLEIVTVPSVGTAGALILDRTFDLYAIDLRLADGDAGVLLELLEEQGDSIAARSLVITSFARLAPAFTSFPVVSKTELTAAGPHFLRILGEPPEHRPGVPA